MPARVAINGLGRIGRAILKLVIDEPGFELVAVNDLVDVENLAYLLRFDTVYGRYSKPVAMRRRRPCRRRPQAADADAAAIPWNSPGRSWASSSCSSAPARSRGARTSREHIRAGARFVLLSAPSKGGEVETVVHGVNVPQRRTSHHLLRELHDELHHADRRDHRSPHRVQEGGDDDRARLHLVASRSSMGRASSFRRGRAAAANLVPATTGAALATTRALPEYAGLFDGIAIRAPIPVGSIADLTFVTSRKTSVDEVNQILTEEAETKRYAGVLGVSRDPLVSSDIVGDPRASVVDLELTKVVDGDLVKVMSWYDNEWGYANQMVREARVMTSPA